MKRAGGWVGHDRSADLPPTAQWQAIKREVRRLYGDTCWMCGQPGADTVDHLGERWDHRPEVLRPVHDRRYPHCHRRRTAEQGHEALRKIRQNGKMPAEAHPGLR